MDGTSVSRNKKNAEEQGAVVVFEDEVLFQQEGTTHRTWAPRGKGFKVYHHPCKRKCRFYGAISIAPKPVFVFQKTDWFNTKSFQRFLDHLLSVFEKVNLILDNVRYHHAKALLPYLEKNKDRLWIHRLPPYSPNLNPVEMVWRETRKEATHNRYFATQIGLTRAVQTQFRLFQAEPSKLSGIVRHFLMN